MSSKHWKHLSRGAWKPKLPKKKAGKKRKSAPTGQDSSETLQALPADFGVLSPCICWPTPRRKGLPPCCKLFGQAVCQWLARVGAALCISLRIFLARLSLLSSACARLIARAQVDPMK